MPQEEFLTLTELNESSLKKDAATGHLFYENEVLFSDGHWKILIWFNAGLLVRIQSEISPCYYDYGD